VSSAGSSRGDGRGHVVNRAEGDGMELAAGGHGFDAAGPDFCGEVKVADGFAEEGSLFVLGFGKGDLNVGPEKDDGQAGEAGSGAEVEECDRANVKVLGGEEAFSEVAADDLLGIADRGEVSAGVPLEEEVEVCAKLGEESGGDIGFGEVRGEQVCDCGLGEGRHGRLSVSQKRGLETCSRSHTI